ncbi:hypothetical protein LMG23992_01368 [Cupriavidus laharis]|uniref:Uncharacterized protein n=1 Tax=Cupriavidus laharis TaxID=151654 RepID=A0ABN7Y6I9_9BURK|nr:hypothetical protein LMG23992_01368 [Cupriavidus laharis]
MALVTGKQVERGVHDGIGNFILATMQGTLTSPMSRPVHGATTPLLTTPSVQLTAMGPIRDGRRPGGWYPSESRPKLPSARYASA